MGLKDCIDTAVRIGKVSSEDAEDYKKRFDNWIKSGYSPSKARELLLTYIDNARLDKERVAGLTEAVRKKVMSEMESYRTAKGNADPTEYLINKHVALEGKFMDAETRRLTLLSKFQEDLDQFKYQFRKGLLTGDKRHDPLSRFASRKVLVRAANIVRELFGEDSKDPAAKAMAQAVAKVMDDARLAFNAAGGFIPKLEKWGMPQFHNRLALINYTRDAWVKRLMQKDVLDRDRIRDHFTDTPLSDAELKEALEHAWHQITTDGFYDYVPQMRQQGKGALWKRNLDHRFIHFKNADEWMKYAKDFGEPDAYAAMTSHISRMARDIAHMETFGPNPEAMRTYLKNYVTANAAKVQAFESMVKERTDKLNVIKDKMLAHQQKLIERLHQIPDQMRDIREKKPGKISLRGKKKIEALHQEFKSILSDLMGGTKTHADLKTEAEFRGALNDLDQVALIPWAKTWNDPAAYAANRIRKADRIWEVMRGSMDGHGGWVGDTLDTARNLITAARLGRAAITSIQDLATNAATRGFVGMARPWHKSYYLQALAHTLKYTGPKAEMQAMRNGLISDSMTHVFHSQARYTGAMNSREFSGWLADRTLSLSGMIPWTQGGKHGFGMDLEGDFADHVGHSYGKLPDRLRNTLDRHGISKDDWEQMRRAPLSEQDGATFLRPREIRDAVGDELAGKYIGAILRETHYAVVEPTAATKAFIKAGTERGTYAGELLRSAAQFKTFSIAFMLQSFGRAMREGQAGKALGAHYAAHLLIGSTIMGAITMALKSLASGQDPQRWVNDDPRTLFQDPSFWGAALLQGGGLGLYGDFLFASTNRFGGGLYESTGGPLIGEANDLGNFFIGNPLKMAQGKPTKAAEQAVRILRANTPIVSSLWYASMIYNRAILDSFQRLIDPEAQASFNRAIMRPKVERHQDFWWNPGEGVPHRAPDMSTIWTAK